MVLKSELISFKEVMEKVMSEESMHNNEGNRAKSETVLDTHSLLENPYRDNELNRLKIQEIVEKYVLFNETRRINRESFREKE